MGGTGTAWPWDATTIFYNPGGLARLKSIQVYASGIGLLCLRHGFRQIKLPVQVASTHSQAQTFVPFNVYVGGPIQEGSNFALGLGIYSLAGIGLNWGNEWQGRYMIESIQLTTVCFQPTISYRISDFLSVGAGFVYGVGNLDLSKALPVQTRPVNDNTDGRGAHLHGNATGEGFNLGVQMKVTDELQIGLTYRSQINIGISAGAASFTVPQSLTTSFPNTTFDSQLPLPQVASIGIGYRPMENLTLQFDLNYTGWNSFRFIAHQFCTEYTASLQNMHEPRHYRNTLTPRIGRMLQNKQGSITYGRCGLRPYPGTGWLCIARSFRMQTA